MGAVSSQPAQAVDVTGDASSEPHHRALVSNDSAELRDVYGPRWVFVPRGLGEAALDAREVLERGLIPIDIDRSDPVRVTNEVGAFARITAQSTRTFADDVVVLGEAFAADLSALPLRRVRRACRAILRLSQAPAFPPAWATPASAQTASVVLGALGDDLRELAEARRGLYEEFSEDVWTVSGRRVSARREFAAVTRSGRQPVDVKRSLATLRRAREVNARIDASWNAVSGHLGHFADRGIPDMDGAKEALAGVMELQHALGEELDQGALRALATADAFVAEELVKPAGRIVAAIDAWELRANRFGGFDPTSHSPRQLAEWARDVETAIATLDTLVEATAPLRACVRSAGHILDDAVRRDRLHRFCEITTAAASA